MTELENKYLSYLSKINKQQTLVDYSIHFIRDEFNLDEFFIVKHQLYPDPYVIIYPDKNSIDVNEIQDDILQLGKNISANKEIGGQRYKYFFLDSIFSTGHGEFYISKESITNELRSILQLWNQQQKIIQKYMHEKENEIKDKQASLASQLMHDVQAIIDLSKNFEKDLQLAKRIEYQKKVNKNYLFWIRDCELLKTDVNVGELINSSLQIIGVDSNILDLNNTVSQKTLSVDVELFSMAINEIVLNALAAVENDLSKIRINVSQCPSVSPFFKKNWTIMEVCDQGSGIPEDFLSVVTNPFFTTRKKEGASGFGLPIAKKIIEAHQGCFELNSVAGMGTIIKLIIPG